MGVDCAILATSEIENGVECINCGNTASQRLDRAYVFNMNGIPTNKWIGKDALVSALNGVIYDSELNGVFDSASYHVYWITVASDFIKGNDDFEYFGIFDEHSDVYEKIMCI